jgi:hypothetical protein
MMMAKWEDKDSELKKNYVESIHYEDSKFVLKFSPQSSVSKQRVCES